MKVFVSFDKSATTSLSPYILITKLFSRNVTLNNLMMYSVHQFSKLDLIGNISFPTDCLSNSAKLNSVGNVGNYNSTNTFDFNIFRYCRRTSNYWKQFCWVGTQQLGLTINVGTKVQVKRIYQVEYKYLLIEIKLFCLIQKEEKTNIEFICFLRTMFSRKKNNKNNIFYRAYSI